MDTAFGEFNEKVFRKQMTSDAENDRGLFHGHLSESYETPEDRLASQSDIATEQTSDDIFRQIKLCNCAYTCLNCHQHYVSDNFNVS